jgi:hypothetical protein
MHIKRYIIDDFTGPPQGCEKNEKKEREKKEDA